MKVYIFAVGSVLAVLTCTQAASQGDLVWAKAFGNGGLDAGIGVAAGPDGSVYTTGRFQGTVGFDPALLGAVFLTSGGADDVFVQKLDSFGRFVWVKQFRGPASALGIKVALDASGNVYIAGRFQGTVDFDPSSGVFNLTSAGSDDAFVAKLEDSGSLLWARRLGGSAADRVEGLAVDTSGAVLITGRFSGTADFDPGGGVSNLVSAGSFDAYVVKLDTNGIFDWAGRFGGTLDDRGFGVTTDGSGNVFAVGRFEGNGDFDPGGGVMNLTSAGGEDAFIVKLTSAGVFAWALRLGGTGNDSAFGVATNAFGDVHLTGRFRGTVDFDPGSGVTSLTSQGLDDAFVLKLTTSGGLHWARQLGGADDQIAIDLAVANDGAVAVTGMFFGSTDFDPGPSAANLVSAGNADIFVMQLDIAGDFMWADRAGDLQFDQGLAIAVDADANVVATGTFRLAADFDPGDSQVILTSAGDGDGFVLKLGDTTFDSSNVYVDFDAPASGNGSLPRPFNTLAVGASFAATGATLHIAPGTSTESVSLSKPQSLTNRDPSGGIVRISADTQPAAKKSGFISANRPKP